MGANSFIYQDGWSNCNPVNVCMIKIWNMTYAQPYELSTKIYIRTCTEIDKYLMQIWYLIIWDDDSILSWKSHTSKLLHFNVQAK